MPQQERGNADAHIQQNIGRRRGNSKRRMIANCFRCKRRERGERAQETGDHQRTNPIGQMRRFGAMNQYANQKATYQVGGQRADRKLDGETVMQPLAQQMSAHRS